MKNDNAAFLKHLCIVVAVILVSLLFWQDIANKLIFVIAATLHLLVSLHKYGIIVLRDINKQYLICTCWYFSATIFYAGFIMISLVELMR